MKSKLSKSDGVDGVKFGGAFRDLFVREEVVAEVRREIPPGFRSIPPWNLR
jgi:hypothetical protein